MIRALPRPTMLVVGTGMAGAKVVEEVLARAPDRFHIRMFGAEPHGTYNRIRLSHVLAGESDERSLWLNPLDWYEDRGVRVHSGVKADVIDRHNRVVIGARGKVVEPYDVLVLATGSRPFVPPLENARRPGVFVFRTIDDCANIAAHAEECDRAVVIGGGLLGLEAARGLLNFGIDVTVLEVAPHLMRQQLDPTGAALLKHKLERMGLTFKLGASATRIHGTPDAVTGIELADGSIVETDMVVISCGIQPNIDEARQAGLHIERGIVVDDQLRTSDADIFAVGECAQHRGKLYGLVEPLYEQAAVAADILTDARPLARYQGSRLSASLKVMGIDLTSMGDVHRDDPSCEIISHLDPQRGTYQKYILQDRQLVGAILLGIGDPSGTLRRHFKDGSVLQESALDLLRRGASPSDGCATRPCDLADTAQICNCNLVSKGTIVKAIESGCKNVDAIGVATRAGTGCGSCRPTLQSLLDARSGATSKPVKNKVEIMKAEKNGLDALDDLFKLAVNDNWQEMSEDDKQRAKWHGLFFRKPTPGHFMLRLRFNAGQTNARQFRTIADLSDEFGKGFCDLTTRQQIQLRWFTLGQTPEIWRRLEDVGLHSRQTGMDNVRGICGCPVAGVTPQELLDPTPVINAYNDMIVDNREFTNLPRKFNVTITGCLENCCHTETQDIALVPAYRELDGQQVNGFNILVGGKQGSGGYTPAVPLDVFARPEEAAELTAEITRIFRDHGSRAARNRSRLSFLVQDRGIGWLRAELQRRREPRLHQAGVDVRKKSHSDHLGIHPQKADVANNLTPHYVGMLVPVGRITTAQLRGVADIAERYGNGEIRITVGQNLIVPNIPEARLGALMEEPLFKELPYAPSPLMRGLVVCTGNDYCGMALIDTKGYALAVAQELEKRTEGRRLLPLTMHWSGCPAGCGLHQVGTIGLQGCRSRVHGEVVDAAHVYVNGKTGPKPALATDLMYDVPISELADALEPLVAYLPR